MIPNKKIILITLSLAKGGAENQLVKLSIFLKKQGFEVEIIHVLSHNDFKGDLSYNNIESKFFKIKSLLGFLKLGRFVYKRRPHLIISFMYGANLIARLLKLIFAIPIITSVRGSDISRFYSILYRLTYEIDNVSTFNSQYALEKFITKQLTNSSKSVLVKNAIKVGPDNFYKKTKASDKLRIVSIAHFRPEKDYETLFRAMEILSNSGILIELNILGHTFGSNWPTEKIKELGLTNSVNILGFVDNSEHYLHVADVLILSSFGEGTPNAILEAMSNKVPVIASNVPGCFELLNESKCGFLFERGDASDLAQKIVIFKDLPRNIKLDLGNRGYNYIKSHFDEIIVFDKWLNLVNNYAK
jgi:glycosyltransferase involved in cell wall biosynthesis